MSESDQKQMWPHCLGHIRFAPESGQKADFFIGTLHNGKCLSHSSADVTKTPATEALRQRMPIGKLTHPRDGSAERDGNIRFQFRPTKR
jgi:hypothetical protein